MALQRLLSYLLVARLVQRERHGSPAMAARATPAAPPRPRPLQSGLALVRDTFKEWSADQAPRLGAALSYYTVFSLAPILLLVISVAGLALGPDAAQGRILEELTSLLGEDAGRLVQTMLAKSAARRSGVIGTVVGVATLIAGATAVMIELESALDRVWKVAPLPGRGWRGLVRDRLLSLGLVLSLGFLMVVSLAASAALSAVGGLLERLFPGASLVGWALSFTLSFAVLGVFFALVFKYLPNARVAWRDVAVGAAATSALFHVGKFGIGLYLGRAGVASPFGAAGSLAVLLVWVYYSAQIILLGAELTRLYADRFGSRVVPRENAVAAPRADPQDQARAPMRGSETASHR